MFGGERLHLSLEPADARQQRLGTTGDERQDHGAEHCNRRCPADKQQVAHV